MNSKPISVIIPAAGASTRFWSSQEAKTSRRLSKNSKVYFPIGTQPLVARVLDVFDEVPSVREMIVSVEPGTQARFKREILSKRKYHKPVLVTGGGDTRARSVWNGLKRASRKSSLVCVHDAARPLVRREWMESLLRHVDGCDGIVLGRAVVPTVKALDLKRQEVEKTLDRSKLFEAQTPQLITKEALLRSYRELGAEAFEATDDSSLVERTGGRIKVLMHSDPNPKVTTYQDWLMLRAVADQNIKNQAPLPLGFGLGSDRHRLVGGRPFFLGGVRLRSSVGPLGHSDGDALLHAIIDGILGAIGAGDIGDFFPDTSKRWKNVKSEVFLKKALALAGKKGSRPVQVDATVFLDRPKLGARKKEIASRLARLLDLPKEKVNLKAKTSEGLGPESKGRAVSCQALVVMQSVQRSL
jgi:2-C-methyl-D-erythritol 4-phosphate cytidylyltransferase / 2-C-methyl-D-erythritol 2,4-cyclodiphosphate synthase